MRSLFGSFALSLALLAVSACTVEDVTLGPPAPPELMDCSEPRVTTEGQVTGARARSGDVCAYMGVPYAKPPVDALRFAPPEPPAPRHDVLAATRPGPVCIQRTDASSVVNMPSLPVMGEEDCLYLNIWQPPGENLPVMVFIHGGAFVLGAGSWALYDGDVLAQEDVVVVTINYRLGPLGFMASPALLDESADGTVGNQGIQDQIQALQWIRDNIASFGGDPGNVTIFGESAGAMSVCTLMTAPQTEGLFHRAIMQSGACTGVSWLERGYANAVTFAEQAGCAGGDSADELACMRDASIEELMEKWTFDTLSDGLQPHVDGVLVPDVPLTVVRDGDHHAVPVMVGSNADEVRPVSLTNFHSFSLRTVGWDVYFDAIDRMFPAAEAAQIQRLYGPDAFDNPFDSWFTLKSDYVLSCPSLVSAQGFSQRVPVWHYLFSWSELGALTEVLGAVHGLELFLLFGQQDVLSLLIPREHQADALALSAHMRQLWSSFARDGVPAGEGLPLWPTVEQGSLILQASPEVDAAVKRDECAFWDELLPVGMDQFTADVNAILDNL